MPNRAYSDSDHFPYVKHFENLPDVSAPTKKSDLRQLRYSCIQTQLVKQITRSIWVQHTSQYALQLTL